MDLVNTLTNPDNIISAFAGMLAFLAIMTTISPAFQRS